MAILILQLNLVLPQELGTKPTLKQAATYLTGIPFLCTCLGTYLPTCTYIDENTYFHT